MCKRSTDDPLVRTFLDRYSLNLLPLPRAGIECGDLFRRDDAGRISTEFKLSSVVSPPLGELDIDPDEPLAALRGTLSHGRDVEFGLGLLEAFLAALGAAGVLSEVGVHYRRTKGATLAFEFRDATRDSVDPGELGELLIDRRLRDDHPLVLRGSRYYVVSGVARSRSLTVHANNRVTTEAGLKAEAVKAAEGRGTVKVHRESDTTVTYEGDRSLVFGVELYELSPDDATSALRMLTPDGPLHSRGAGPPKLEPAFLGADGDAFLQLDDGIRG